MRSLTNRAIPICIIYLYYLQSGTTMDCPTGNIPAINWKFASESTQPVDNLTRSLEESDRFGKYLRVTGKNVTQNFTILLFAVPYVKSELDCPGHYQLEERLGSLRRHRCGYRVSHQKFTWFDWSYTMIFTGCYYTVMQNFEGKSWIVGPDFFVTNYTYLDTNVTVTKTQVDPEDANKNKELITELKVPLPCIRVDASLYEWKGRIGNVSHDLIRNEILTGRMESKQQCLISNVDNERAVTRCGRSKLSTNLTLEVVRGSFVKKGGWTTVIKWTNLPSGGNTYYLRFGPLILTCYPSGGNDSHLQTDLNAWKPVAHYALLDLGYLSNDNLPPGDKESDTFDWLEVLFSALGVIAIAILVYWIYRFFKIISKRKFERNASSERRQEISYSMHGEEESQQILLMYVKDSGLFMDAMENLRTHLTRDCHCHVHDVYATDEWKMVGELGATGWVEKLLKDGSRVVWVDTPKFRSRLNNKQNQILADDFRDTAVLYAVDLSKDLFLNATTQYRRHFVVRVKGFEVDDLQDDPLLVISPHVRYHIPAHLSQLIEQLRSPPQSSENTTSAL